MTWLRSTGLDVLVHAIVATALTALAWYKVLEQDGPFNVHLASSSGGVADAIGAVFRPTRSIKGVAPSTFNAQSTTGNPDPQNVLASQGHAPLIVFGFVLAAGSSNFPFSSVTPPFGTVLSPNEVDGSLGFTIYDRNPQDYTIDTGDGGPSTGLASGYIEFS